MVTAARHYKYNVGDRVVVSTDAWWAFVPRKLPHVIQAVITDRKPRPNGENFPYYLLRFDPPLHGLSEHWTVEHHILSRADDYTSPTHIFYSVISSGPLLFLRAPMPGLRRGAFRKALASVLRLYRLKVADVSAILTREGTVSAADAALVHRLQRAYAGDRDSVKDHELYELYDWNGDGFVLVRGAADTSVTVDGG